MHVRVDRSHADAPPVYHNIGVALNSLMSENGDESRLYLRAAAENKMPIYHSTTGQSASTSTNNMLNNLAKGFNRTI